MSSAAEFELHTGTYPEDREPGKKMGEKLKPLSDAEVETLAQYYASQQ